MRIFCQQMILMKYALFLLFLKKQINLKSSASYRFGFIGYYVASDDNRR